MSSHGADWLERAEREAEEQPDLVMDAMQLRDGQTVAEIGAGTGYFARRMARRVSPSGKVFAVDIQPEMLTLLARYVREEGVTNIVPVLGGETDPRLPEKSVDWILLVDVYHEFQKPQPMLARIRESLTPGGRVALVEYRQEGESAGHIKREHRMSVEQVRAEWEAAGFEIVEIDERLKSQHLFILRVAQRR
ncbi:MAG TPA: class I SAM-dependent methyltransferase [Thermoanaerobaculia bacterium]|nr:class I SAM-dependent methyltransferase [Thermoanaerobaculia bacterium]